MPKVSVIVPVYKAEQYLHNCIDSILNQIYRDFELILVDDGSPDKSGEICDKYAKNDDRIRVIHKKNGGVSSARNEGMHAAKGEYICFVDSDDFAENDYLKNLLDVKSNYPDCDNIWCGFQTVSDYSKKGCNKVIAEENKEVSFYDENDITFLHKKWLDASPFNKLYLRKVICDNNLKMDINLSLGEDLIFNLQYMDCTNKKIAVINRPLYNYIRTEKESLDNKYYPDLFSIYKKIHNTMFYYADRWNLSKESRADIYSFEFFKFEVVLKNTMSKQNPDNLFKKIGYNKKIMKSRDFVDCLNNMNADINKIFLKAYKTGSFVLVEFLNKILKLKLKMTHKSQRNGL